MYPAKYWQTFVTLPAKKQVFVAMPFSDEFQPRYEEVIFPALDDLDLNPYRVDASSISDSVIDEILAGIGESVLVLADISTDSTGYRNGNVMYEIGLAHAHRPPESVILLRSDSDKLLFDLSNVRVSGYDPDGDSDAAKRTVSDLVKQNLRQLDLTLSDIVASAIRVLDHRSLNFLTRMLEKQFRYYPKDDDPKTFLDRLFAYSPSGQLSRLTTQRIIERLLGAGLIETIHPSVSDFGKSTEEQLAALREFLKTNEDIPDGYLCYEITTLGFYVLSRYLDDTGMVQLYMEHPELHGDFESWSRNFGRAKENG